ncbi:cytochrome d ubiquinol oxidase subunit II [Streptomyces polyrhachis]|uniref:Cytochrome d ubiquinol oxidase subunit II n=1 Tax=Streptomyces polyrhachis TaxID=1282885 RepID=A0ABW2GJ80_9ACTN
MHLYDLWFILIAVLWIGYFFLEGFDFGIGILSKVMPRDNAERRVLLGTIGPVWAGNETWLITAGGATFAAFPVWYASLFSSFYIPLLIILVCLIIRGVAFEYRGKRAEERWQRGWEECIFVTSLLIAFLWGVTFAAMLRGIALGKDGVYMGTLGDLFSAYSVLGGATTLVLFTYHGAVFASLKTAGDIQQRARGYAAGIGALTVALSLAFLIWTQVEYGDGWTLALLIIAALALTASIGANRINRNGWAFAFSGATVIAAFTLVFVALFPDVMPSSLGPQWSLTVENASSAPYTLKVMTVVSAVFVPLVLAYTGWTYWVFRQRLTVHTPVGAH